jgi:hypothetical protein
MTDLISSRTDLFNFASLISSGEGTTLCHFLESSHRKGPQDAAGGLLKTRRIWP